MKKLPGLFLLTRDSGVFLLAVIAVFANGSCSSPQREANNKNAPPAAQTREAAAESAPAQGEPDFDVTGAWRPKNVKIKMQPGIGVGMSPGMTATISVEAGNTLIAIELTLKKLRRSEPVRINATLVDSSGEHHKALFQFPAAASRYKVNGDSVLFDNGYEQGDKKLGELGGKQISLFRVPSDRSGFNVEVDGAKPVAIEMKSR